MAPSNLASLCWLFSKHADAHVKVFHLDPLRHFGVPQGRGRLWMCCIPRACLRSAGLTDSEASQELEEIMIQLVGSQAANVDEYLFGERSAPVVQYNQHLTSRKRDASSSRRDIVKKRMRTGSISTKSWQEKHV